MLKRYKVAFCGDFVFQNATDEKQAVQLAWPHAIEKQRRDVVAGRRPTISADLGSSESFGKVAAAIHSPRY